MNYPEKALAMNLLKEWQNLHDELKAVHAAAKKVFGCEPESPFFDVTWRVFDAYTRALAENLGDSGAVWLEWFYAENEMGARGHEAGYDGKMKPIKTLTDLYGLILQGRARK